MTASPATNAAQTDAGPQGPAGGAERSGEPIIVLENLTAGYGEKVILKDVSFTVDRGEIVVIAGGSGCGKSTLLRHMIGLNPLMGGRVVIDGVDVHEANSREMARLRTTIGVLFQSGALLGSLTLAENVALPLEDHTNLDRQTMAEVVRMKLDLVDLGFAEELLPGELSGGMKKRGGLARAMALDPLVLFFDEPSAGLDPITSAELDQLILKLNRALDTTMIIVTHELASIFTIAHRVVMLDKDVQGLLAVGPPEELRDNSRDPKVRAFFSREPREES